MILFSQRFPRQGTPESAKTTLVFLHGLGGTGALWRPIIAHLEEEYACIVVDQRGHGESQNVPPGRGFGPDDYATDVIETLAALGVQNCVLIGHSMGVRTACAVAAKIPAKTDGLVLIDLGLTPAAGAGMGHVLFEFLEVLPERFSDRPKAKQFIETHCPDPAIAQYLIAVLRMDPNTNALYFPFKRSAVLETIRLARQTPIHPYLQKYLEARAAFSATDDFTSPAKSVTTRVLVLRGENSLVYSKAQEEGTKKLFADYPAVQFIEVAGAGHGLPFEKRAEFLELVRAFVRQCGLKQ